MRHVRRPSAAIAIGLAIGAILLLPAAALASKQQLAMFEDGAQLHADPKGTLATLRLLGVGIVRVVVGWNTVAPHAGSRNHPNARFNSLDPASYPAANWAPYDAIVRDAQADGIKVALTVTGPAPLWATGSGAPKDKPHGQWKPSAIGFRHFVRAVGVRYSGSFKPHGASSPLPAVNYWVIWNEPNFGPDLAPQAINNSTVSTSPAMYRGLVDAAWTALQATGHGSDTIIIGELAARGLSGPPSRGAPQGFPGNFAMTKPLQFLRTLYCVGSSYRQLRGSAAAAVGCPTTSAGSGGFRAAHPGLFHAGAFSDHPYALPPGQSYPPTTDGKSDPDFATFSELPRLERVLNRLQGAYSSSTHFPIDLTEYGYITRPPNSSKFVSLSTAAYYMNWAEFIAWHDPRIQAIAQFLLYDPTRPKQGSSGSSDQFASGLQFSNGGHKPGFNAYRLPIYLPVTSTRHGSSLEVWGCVRPAGFATADTGGTPQTVRIQFQPGSQGAFNPVQTVTITDRHGYFDVHQTFTGKGSVRLSWTYPNGTTITSRSVSITN